MSSNPAIDRALDVLREAGHKVGRAYLRDSQTDGGLVIPVDDVPRSFDEILEMARKQESGSSQSGSACQ